MKTVSTRCSFDDRQQHIIDKFQNLSEVSLAENAVQILIDHEIQMILNDTRFNFIEESILVFLKNYTSFK